MAETDERQKNEHVWRKDGEWDVRMRAQGVAKSLNREIEKRGSSRDRRQSGVDWKPYSLTAPPKPTVDGLHDILSA